MPELSIARSMTPFRAFVPVLGAILISTLPWLLAAIPARAQMPAPTPTASNLIEGLSQSAGSIGDSADALASHPEAAALLNSDEFRWLRANPEAQLTADEYRQLCAAIAAKHISPQDIQSLGPALGLSSQQLAQVTSCSSAQPAQSYAGSPMNTRPAAGPAGAPTPSYISSIEARFHDLDTPYKLLSQPSTQQLSQFGYELFSSKVSTFAPAENAPVSDDYVLGPGDTINVLLWGRINQTFALQVQRDGAILMPEIGPIEVSGLTFGQTKRLIEHRGSEITGLQVDVTMGQVRAIQVFVIGKVVQPGLYTVSSLSHVSNALVAAGGVSKMGSLRNIQLRRDNHLIGTLDVYDLLLRGDTSGDLGLKPRDVIFVPGDPAGGRHNRRRPRPFDLRAQGKSDRGQRTENGRRRDRLRLRREGPDRAGGKSPAQGCAGPEPQRRCGGNVSGQRRRPDQGLHRPAA